MTPTTTARVLHPSGSDADGFLPEGPRPITLDGRNGLLWVNIQTNPAALEGALHLRFWDTGEHRHWTLAGRPGFALPTDRPGVLLVGLDQLVGTFDLTTGTFRPLAQVPDAHPRTIINDAEVVPGGRAVVFGTKDTAFKEPVAGLYLYTLDDDVISLLAPGQTCSNGKVFAHYMQDVVLFDIDTPTKTVARYRFDLGSRTVAFDGVALDLSGQAGFPDGMRAGGEGTAVIAFYNPDPAGHGRAVRFDLSTGQAVHEWHLPGSPRVTCPCVVERSGGVQVVFTTATEGMPADQREDAPAAGHLFIAETDLVACPPAEIVRFNP